MNAKITKDRVRHHFAYSWWKYAALVIAAVLGWNLIYTATAYRAPKDKRLDVYFVSSAIADTAADTLRAQILEMFPDVEDASVVSVVYTEEDSYYGTMQLSTYVGAGEGDIYILPRERFEAFAGGGAFVPLDEAADSGALRLQGIDAGGGVMADEETGETALYGIPAAELYGMMEKMGIDNRDLVICVMAYSQNKDRAVAFIDWLIEDMLAPKPDWLVEQEKQFGESKDNVVSDIPSF